MRRLYCLFLNRDNLKDGLRVIQTAIEYIHQGISVFVFPEGTRTRTGEMGTFKEGTFKIASRTNCRIVPVAFSNTENIFEAHFPFITSTTVTVHFGEPIDVSRFDKEGKKHLGAYTQHVIADMLEQVSAN
jgi:1-acyl-sn-glycerol-3-phosphate acyltransferase